jgi:acyl dehydratase
MKLADALGESSSFSKTYTEFDQGAFAAISGDFDPLHMDEAYAATTQFGRRIAHGIAILGLLSSAESAVSQRLVAKGLVGKPLSLGYDRIRFVAPVYIGDNLCARYKITEVDTERQRLTGHCEIIKNDGEIVLIGTHVMAIAS